MVSLKEWHGRPACESTRKMRGLRLLKEIDMPVGALSLAYETTDQELKAISDEFETAPPRKSGHCRKLKTPHALLRSSKAHARAWPSRTFRENTFLSAPW